MKKGCLTGFAIFFAICLLFGMCSSNSGEDVSTIPSTESIIDNASELTETPVSDTINSTDEVDSESTHVNTTETTETTEIAEIIETTEAVQTPSLHIHEFSAATCLAPKTCSCGETEGSANGHVWKDANCSEPKTCTVCGATSGLTAGHDFVKGKCVACGKTDPDYVTETMVWIPTKGGKKYHSSASCSNMDDPELVTQSEAEELGFTPCKKCH